MKRIAIAMLAMSCSLPKLDGSEDMEPPPPPRAGSDAGTGTMVRDDIQVTRQSLNGVSVRISFVTNWDRDWDTIIKYFSAEDGPVGGYAPAPAYESTMFNLYVAEPVYGGGYGPALYSGATYPTSSTYLAGRPAVCGHKAGFSRMQYDFPALSNLVPGHVVTIWLMLRCSSGSWPVGSPPENQWSWSFVVPYNPGTYTYYPAVSGFFGNKTWWRTWFQACGNVMDQAWGQSTVLKMWRCYRPNPPSCVCLSETIDATWQ